MAPLEGRALLSAVTALTCLGFLLIGYDNGLLGGLVNAQAFKESFGSPSPAVTGFIVAIYDVGCFLGSVATSIFGEKLGRKRSIATGVATMLIGALLQASSYSRTQIVVSRVVSGVGMGWINSTVPVFQAEFSPKATRGLYVCMQLSTLNFGIFLAYWVDFSFTQSFTASLAWRIPVIIQCVFLIPMGFLIFLVPETPRYLAIHAAPSKSLAVLRRLHSKTLSTDRINALHKSILETSRLEASIDTGSWRDLFHKDAISSQYRFLLACGIQSFQQLGGINALVSYSSTLFESSIGLSPHLSALFSGFLQTWFFVASFIPWLLIDRVGRRPLLLSMISVMAAVMAVQAGLVSVIDNQPGTVLARSAAIGATTMLFVFEGAFTIGFQATVWVYPSEILPLRLRQRGSAISTACNWILNYLVVQTTPIALDKIGYPTYIIFAVLNATWIPVIYFFFPETKGLELEEVDKLFLKDGIVSEAEGLLNTEQESSELTGSQ